MSLPLRLLIPLLLALPLPALAQARYRVSLLTMSPGPHPFERFGHSALAIEDLQSGDEIAYNFGTFNGDMDGLFVRALRKELPYWLSTLNAGETAMRYAEREIQVQELSVADAKVAALLEALRDNLRPENRVYAYDPFVNNCVTRIRDLLDHAWDGALRRQTGGPAPSTYRQDVYRALAPVPLMVAAAHLVYGPYTDLPRTRWEAMFLPQALHDALAAATLDGHPAVRAERRWRGESFTPPGPMPQPLFFLSALLLCLSLGLFYLARSRKAPEAGRTALQIVGWTGAGALLASGSIGGLLWLCGTTPHAFAQDNANRWFLSPLDLLLAPVLALLAQGRLAARGRRLLGVLLALTLLLPLLHLFQAHLLGACPQQHGAVMGTALGLRLLLYGVTILCAYLLRPARRRETAERPAEECLPTWPPPPMPDSSPAR